MLECFETVFLRGFGRRFRIEEPMTQLGEPHGSGII